MSESLDNDLAALRAAIANVPDWDGRAPQWEPPAHPAPGEPVRATDPWSADQRWTELDRGLDRPVAGRRVLVVGGDVAADVAAFTIRSAGEVVGCSDWQTLDADAHGRFDVVHCHDLLHRVPDPLGLLARLRAMTADGGLLLLSTMMLIDAERSEYLRFVPDQFAGDPSWCFIPGRLATRWMIQAAGYEIEAEFAEHEGPRDRIPVLASYLRAAAV